MRRVEASVRRSAVRRRSRRADRHRRRTRSCRLRGVGTGRPRRRDRHPAPRRADDRVADRLRRRTSRPARTGSSTTGDRSRFGWAVGPQPWKPLLHPPSVATMHLTQPGIDATGHGQPCRVVRRSRLALFGMRPCDLAALDMLDHVLLGCPAIRRARPIDARRDDAFLVVVNCGVPASTCCCTSFGTGPHVDERRGSPRPRDHRTRRPPTRSDDPDYVVTAISERGIGRARTGRRSAGAPRPTSDGASRRGRSSNARQLPRRSNATCRPIGSHEALADAAHDLDRWTTVAEQCVACGNCTAVCPTCFCTTINDVGDLSGTHVERRREWESCFSSRVQPTR